jgi:alpha-D-ribose 1-methylphosphonate 5-triphosphate synthase subunit PhnG
MMPTAAPNPSNSSRGPEPTAADAPSLLTDQAAYLAVLAQCRGDTLKAFVDERLLPVLPPVTVLHNASGLYMVPARDTARGTVHHLGEALVSEARVRLADTEGYGACLGPDLQRALAAAIVDAAIRSGCELPAVAAFVAEEALRLAAEEARQRAQVEATRVEMETF